MRCAALGMAMATATAGCWSSRHGDAGEEGSISDRDDGGRVVDDAGSGDDDDAATDAPPDAGVRSQAHDAMERYCTDLAEASCAAIEACCEGGWEAPRREECRRGLHDPCVGSLTVVVDRGEVTIDAAGAAACTEAITAAVAGCPDELLEPAWLPECTGAIRGSAPVGDCCEAGCGFGTGCARVDDEVCEEGATCEALPGEGEWCLAGWQCQRGLACEGGACRAPQSAGAECEWDSGCLGRCNGECVAEPWLYCERLPEF